MSPRKKTKQTSGNVVTKTKPAQGKSDDTKLPDWPPLTPRIPHDDLELAVRLSDQILTISKLWASALCKRYVEFLSSLPLTTTPGKPKKGEAVRVNDRFQADDAVFAERLWNETALCHLVQHTTIGGQELDDQQRSDLWGDDESNNVMFKSSDTQSIPARTTWTLLLYLTAPSTGCIGGETVFYPEAANKREAAPQPIVTELEVGMALLHRHGSECLLHEGREVKSGEKWLIRSDLVVKR
ncbi:hypothetical protein MRB53_042346 [Persea americana]|nr:hypothetical protein MRB53_042346 [Persea americana]